jgi:WD40 repeat protein
MPAAPDYLSDLAVKIDAFSSLHTRPPAPALRPRPPHIVLSSLRGDLCALEAATEWFNIDEQQRVIRFFVSSTFVDTQHERDVLLKCVMPAIQRYARAVGFGVVMSEMRFGIRQSLSDDHKTTEVCMAELQRCIETSAGLSYILLSCNRYGFRPPPRRIPAVDMDGMMACMSAADRLIALEYYTLDENVARTPQECYNISLNMHGAANVPGPAYVLNGVGKVTNFWSRFPLLQNIFRSAANQYWPSASSIHLRNPYSQHPIKFFIFSITEEEISRGVFWRDGTQLPHSVHVFQRTLQASGSFSLQQLPPSTPQLKNFIDLSVDSTSVDSEAAQLLSEQQDMLQQALAIAPACFTNFHPLEWQAGKGVDPAYPEHMAYLQQFAEEAIDRLLRSTDDASQRLAVQCHADMAEAIFHLKFAQRRGSKFAHSHETGRVTEPLNRYLASGGSCGHACIVWGASGSGKTYLLAECADREARSIRSDPDAAVIVRFLGTTPASSSVLPLLCSICTQLHAISNSFAEESSSSEANDDENDTNETEDFNGSDDDDSDPSLFQTDFDKLQTYFQVALRTWRHGRLVIFLDSVDQLDDSVGGRRLNWLPTHGLAPGVRLVISTLPDDPSPADGKPFKCLSALQSRHLPPSCVLEVQPVEDVSLLFSHILKFHKQTFTPNQLAVIDAAVKKSPRTQTPLVVTILANRLSDWPSHADLDVDSIDTSSVRALIIQEFKVLELKHGAAIVRSSLAFITLARDGLSETELLEILSLDDDVLASVYEWWVPATRTLPTNPLTMLLADLKPYLTMRGASNGASGLMMRWYHRQFWEAANEYFLHDADERRRRHAQLGEFFSGMWADHEKPYNPKLKLVIEKKVTGEDSGDRKVRPQPFCLKPGQNIFLTKGDAGAVNERRCREVAYHFLAADMLCDAADELCSFEGICAHARCGEGFALQQQLLELGPRIRKQIACRDGRAVHVLRRVEHYARWLQRDMSAIVDDPEAEIVSSCSRQPEVSLARKDLQDYLQRTSGGLSFESNAVYRSFVLGASHNDFDSCSYELKHHTGRVTCVAYNADGSLLASASWDKTVCIWNTKTGTLEGILKGHTDWVTSVAWSPCCSQLVTCSRDKTIRLWDATTQSVKATLQGSSHCVLAVAFDPSGGYIASGSEDKSVSLWDVTTCSVIGTLQGHTDAVLTVAFDRSGKCFASGSRDMTIRLWDLTTHHSVAILTGHSGWVLAVAFDACGAYVASGSEDKTIRLWDVTTHQTIVTLKGHVGYVRAVAFDASGGYIASGSEDNTVRIWDLTTHKAIATLKGHSHYVYAVAFDASERYIASGSADKSVRLWDLTAHKMIVTLQGHSDAVRAVAIDSSGRHLASGSADNTIRLWDTNTKQVIATLQGHSGPVIAVAFDTNGTYIASGSADKTIRLWDSTTHQAIAVMKGHSGWVFDVSFDASGRYIASGSGDKTIRLWDVTTHKAIAILQELSTEVFAVAFDKNGKYFASGSRDKTIRLWDVTTRSMIANLKGHSAGVGAIAFDVSGTKIASGSRDKTIRVWDVILRKEIATLQGHSNMVHAVTFDASGGYIASGSADKTVRLWDVATHQVIATLQGHSDEVSAVIFDASGRFIISGSLDGTIRLWDTQSRYISIHLSGHSIPNTLSSPSLSLLAAPSSNIVNCLRGNFSGNAIATTTFTLHSAATIVCTAWSVDGTLFATGAHDGSVVVWDADTGLQRAVLQCPHAAAMSAITMSPDARLIVVVVDVAPACVHVFELKSASLLASPALHVVGSGPHWSADGCTLQDAQGGDLWHLP